MGSGPGAAAASLTVGADTEGDSAVIGGSYCTEPDWRPADLKHPFGVETLLLTGVETLPSSGNRRPKTAIALTMLPSKSVVDMLVCLKYLQATLTGYAGAPMVNFRPPTGQLYSA